MVKTKNLYVDQGAVVTFNIPVDNALNLANHSFAMAASKLYSSYVVIEGDITKNPITSQNQSNSIDLVISGDQTIDADPGKYVYDVMMTNTITGASQKIMQGLLFINQTITKI